MKRSEALERLVQDHLRRGLSPNTTAARRRTAERFLERSRKSVLRIKPEDVRAYLARRRAEGIAGTTRALELSNLRAFFDVVGTKNPTAKIRVEHGGPRAPCVPSQANVEALLSECLKGPGSTWGKLRDRACIELLYGAGLRVSEAAAVEITDLSLAEQTVLVRSAKRGKPRLLPLPQRAVEHVTRYLREGRPLIVKRGESGARLLLTRDGRPMQGRVVTSVVDRVAKRAGLKIHAHALRRALATHLVAEGVSVEGVRQILGHAELETTALYVAVSREELRRVVQSLELD